MWPMWRGIVIVVFLLVCAFPLQASAGVTYDTNCSALVQGTSPRTLSCTIAANSNMALFVYVRFATNDVAPVTATWDSGGSNQSMTSIVSTSDYNGNGYHVLFGLINPASGNKTLSVSWATGTPHMHIGIISFYGVDQTTAWASSAASSPACGSGTCTATVTTVSGDIALAAYSTDVGTVSVSTGTQLWCENTDSTFHNCAAYVTASGASTDVVFGSPGRPDTRVSVAVKQSTATTRRRVIRE